MIELSRSEQWNIRSKIFIHMDGIAIGPIIATLWERGIFDLFNAQRIVSMSEIIDHSKSSNAAYLHVAMRLLASQGLFTRTGKPGSDSIKYALTSKGDIITRMAFAYQRAMAFLPIALEMNRAFFAKPFYLTAAARASYCMLVEQAKRGWELPEEIEPLRKKALEQVIDHNNGLLIGPTMVLLKSQGVFDILTSHKHVAIDTIAERIEGDAAVLSIAFNLLEYQGWLTIRGNNRIALSPEGAFAAARAWAYGMIVSYMPTFTQMDNVLFGDPSILWCRDATGHELHVNRQMNIKASGAGHRTYFRAIDEIITSIFNRPIDEQPRFIADMGCGDGTFLKHLWEIIRDKTLRGSLMREEPDHIQYKLLMVGADFNQASRDIAHENLTKAGIPHVVLFGDIHDPERFAKDLDTDHIKIEDGLHVRSFLDHNRQYQPPRDMNAAKQRKSTSTGAFAWRSQIISNNELEQNLVEHLHQWASFIGKHGLLILEHHIIPTAVAAQHIGRTVATSHDAIHGFSDQLSVELPIFLAAAKEAGLVADKRYQRAIPPAEQATISINLFFPQSSINESARIKE